MSRTRQVLLGTAIAAILAAIVSGVVYATTTETRRANNRASVFVHFDDKGKATDYCGYITDVTKETECGKSGVPRTRWVSPDMEELFDQADGIDPADQAVGHLVCVAGRERLTGHEISGSTTKWESWIDANGGREVLCREYTQWLAGTESRFRSATASTRPTGTPASSRAAQPSPTRASPTRSRSS